MPRQAGISVANNFNKGLITEATGLNFPESSVVETYDCIFDKTGEVYRRGGLAYETNAEASAVDAEDAAITEFLWDAVGKNGEITFIVLQVGDILSFFRTTSDQVISGSKEDFFVDITDFQVDGSPATKGIPCSFTSGNGLLFVAHPYCTPFFVEYDEEENDITDTAIDIKIRDTKGLPNTNASGNVIEVDYHPNQAEMSNNIAYNLLNQGWHASSACVLNNRAETYKVQNVLAFYYANSQRIGAGTGGNAGFSEKKYPAECDIWWGYKAPLTPASGGSGSVREAFSRTEFISNESKFGTAAAPKGHYLLDAFNLDRTAAATADAEQVNGTGTGGGGSGGLFTGETGTDTANITVAGIEVETSGYQRPAQIVFYAGRVFYAGVNSSGFNTKIYFSQILDGKKNVEKCYQQQDLTSEQFNDLLATDGGVLEIPDMARVIKMFVVGSALFIFATNGIWRVSGSEGLGFTPLDFSIGNVSNIGAQTASSFVDVDGTPMWWNVDGIWTFGQADPRGKPTIQSITDKTIKTFFDSIPNQAKSFAKGAFNPFTRVVQWLYRSTEEPIPDEGTDASISEHYQYDRILNLDLSSGAFYPWRIPDTCLQIAGILVLKGSAVDYATRDVTVGGVNVTVGGVDVTVTEPVRSVVTSSVFKYVTLDTCNLLNEDGDSPGITFDSGFIDALDDSFSTSLAIRNHHQMCIGEDGFYYIPLPISDSVDDFLMFDGTSCTEVSLVEADIRTDIEGQVGVLTGGGASWDNGHKIIPFPNSPYFYVFVSITQTGANVYGFFALYKIVDSTTIEFQDAVRGYDTNFSYMFLQVHGVGYEGMGSDPELHNLLVATSRKWSSDSGFSSVITLPNVTSITSTKVLDGPNVITGSNDVTDPVNNDAHFVSIMNENVGEELLPWGFFRRDSTVTGLGSGLTGDVNVFFLPTRTGDTWGNTVNVYIPKSVIDYYIANPTPTVGVGYSTLIEGFVDNDTTQKAFVLTMDLDDPDAEWEVNTNLGIPFGDEATERDNSAISNNRTGYLSPHIRHDVDNELYYMSWTKRFDDTEANLTPTGTYHKVKTYLWDPEEREATIIDSAEGNTYDVVADLGFLEAARYDYCPKFVYTFWNDAVDQLYIVNGNFGFGTDDRTIVSEFGTWVPPAPGIVDVSFSEFSDFDNYLDWADDVDHETDFTSYFITSYKLRGEGIRKFQNNYIRFFTRNDNPSTFDFYGRWDYANASTDGRWGQVQRVIMEADPVNFNTKRLKVRGHGLALNMYVSSVTGEPFNIIGWVNLETANATV